MNLRMDLCFKLYTLLYSAADRGAGRGLGLPGDGPQQQRGGARREGDAVCLPAAAAQAQELLLQAAVSRAWFCAMLEENLHIF